MDLLLGSILTMILLLFLYFVKCQGFLLDASTPLPTARTVITDSHFSMLLNLLVEERNLREQLEKMVKQHQQEIDIMNKMLNNCNCNKQSVDVNDFNNKTKQLEDKVEVLQQNVHSVQVVNAQIEQKQIIAENTSRYIEKDISCLKQLQSVSDLQTILMLQNRTTNIEIRQQQTENTVQSVLSSANARSQDFLALLNKLQISDNTTIQLQSELQNTNSRLNLSVFNLNGRLEIQMNSLQNTFNTSLSNVQKTMDSAIKQLARISNRAILSVHAAGGTVPNSAVLPFKLVDTSHGIKNLTSVKSNAKFECENKGTYLISVFVTTNSNVAGYYYIYKNANYINYVYADLESYSHTSSASVVTYLDAGDTVFIRNGPTMNITPGGTHLSIIQIG